MPFPNAGLTAGRPSSYQPDRTIAEAAAADVEDLTQRLNAGDVSSGDLYGGERRSGVTTYTLAAGGPGAELIVTVGSYLYLYTEPTGQAAVVLPAHLGDALVAALET